MVFPSLDKAHIDIVKLEDYCLNSEHPIGKFKARVFQSVLRLEKKDAEKLRDAILAELRNGLANQGREDQYGTRYIVDLNIVNLNLRATVRTIWIIARDEDFPRFVTCYVINR
jgi:hypothetical protein